MVVLVRQLTPKMGGTPLLEAVFTDAEEGTVTFWPLLSPAAGDKIPFFYPNLHAYSITFQQVRYLKNTHNTPSQLEH